MKFKFFWVPAVDSAAAEAELNAFVAGRRVVGVEKGFSPNGAAIFQPRAERCAALGYGIEHPFRPEGARHRSSASAGVGRPFRALRRIDAESQGDALGWNGVAPLGLRTSAADAGRLTRSSRCRCGAVAVPMPPGTGRDASRRQPNVSGGSGGREIIFKLGARLWRPHQGLRLPRLRSERWRGLGRGGAPQGWNDRKGQAPLSPALSPFVPHGARETDALLVTAFWARTFATIDRVGCPQPTVAPPDALDGRRRGEDTAPYRLRLALHTRPGSGDAPPAWRGA